jgi:hypothetical protein
MPPNPILESHENPPVAAASGAAPYRLATPRWILPHLRVTFFEERC